ncbi:TRAP transporter small permease [Sulfitobacter sp. D35]|uniref:TRAP transporter small permease n=1 Tax=Sulfitobacter sp. D35 TaxID=3083252 RepID=UPI00296E520F|nr:TRAP transporter small permease [Sulfitobacter sp. D35]MDW4499985.1 TRAP transporter small permease [Sulfitobacter sp. D35]
MRLRLIRWLDLLLQAVTIGLIIILAVIVLMAVAFRYSGASLIWYDEVAIVLLAWITYTGAALAVLRNAHLGFAGLLYGLPQAGRFVLFAINEIVFIGAFAVVVWGSWVMLGIFGSETMTTLRWVPRWFIQGIVPVAGILMILGRLLTLPERLGNVRSGRDPDSEEIAQELARAEAEIAAQKEKAQR